ncbi:MAG: hypothetical protein VB934_14765 [Polyangiaceae bacterium]
MSSAPPHPSARYRTRPVAGFNILAIERNPPKAHVNGSEAARGSDQLACCGPEEE